jgi:RecA-family ATPase
MSLEDQFAAAEYEAEAEKPNKLNIAAETYFMNSFSIDKFKSPSYRIKNILPEKGTAVITGESGTGKSFIVTHMLASITTGRKYLGNNVHAANTMYVYGEGGDGSDLELRYMAHVQRYSKGSNEFYTDTHKVHFISSIWNMADADSVSEIIEYINEHDIKVIVLETLNQMLNGSSNDDDAIRKFMLGAREVVQQCGCLVIIIHHPPKGLTSDYSGSAVLRNNSDVMIGLRKADKKKGEEEVEVEVEVGALRLFCIKSRSGSDTWGYNILRKTVVLGTDNEGDDITSCVIEHVLKEKSTLNVDRLEMIRQDCFSGNSRITRKALVEASKTHSEASKWSVDERKKFISRGIEDSQKAGIKVRQVGVDDVVWGSSEPTTAFDGLFEGTLQ